MPAPQTQAVAPNNVVASYRVQCIQTTFGGGYYTAWTTLPYQPAGIVPCPPIFGYGYGYYPRPAIVLGFHFGRR